MPVTAPQKTVISPGKSVPRVSAVLESLAEKYAGIPFDDSRVVKYGTTPGWEVLRQKAAPLTEITEEHRQLVAEMADIMYAAHGVGLAAPQVGKSIRLIIYDAGEGLRALINPEILAMKGEQWQPEEGCLSIPGLRGTVRRANEIKVRTQDIHGQTLYFKAKELEARIIQHEIDHLEGILFTARADPKSLRMLTPEEIEEEHHQGVSEAV